MFSSSFFQNRKRIFAGIFSTLILLAVISIFFVRSLELRIPNLNKPYWEDEIHENWCLFICGSVAELPNNTSWLISPALSYLIKYKIWFNIFEPDELGLRLPSLIYGMLTILLSSFFIFLWGKRQKYHLYLTILFTIIILMWITYHKLEIYYSAEARFYSFVSMVSLCWFGVYFLTRKNYYTLACTSLIFANTHFLSFPLILTAYLCEVVVATKKKDRNKFFIHILTVCIIVLLTIAINYPAWNYMFNQTPGKADNTVFDSIVPGLELLRNYYTEYLLYPFSFPFFFLFIPLLPFVRKERIQKVLLFAFVTLPVLFIYIRMQSHYGFRIRYYFPYFGLGFVIIIYFLDSIYRILLFAADKFTSGKMNFGFADRIISIYNKYCFRISKVTLVLLFFYLLFVSKIIAFGKQPLLIVKDWKKISLPAKGNFSEYYMTYEKLKNLKTPFFLINSRPGANDRPLIYMKYIGKPFEMKYFVVDSIGAYPTRKEAIKLLKSFLKDYPTGVVVLDQIAYYSCPGFNISLKSLPLPAKKLSRCTIAIENASSVGQIESIAKKLKFRMMPNFFKE